MTICNLNPLKLSEVDKCGKMGQLIAVQSEISRLVMAKSKVRWTRKD